MRLSWQLISKIEYNRLRAS